MHSGAGEERMMTCGTGESAEGGRQAQEVETVFSWYGHMTDEALHYFV